MLYTFALDPDRIKISRDELIMRLRERGIQAKVYFYPAHLQPLFTGRGSREGDLPVTEDLSHRILSLPVYSMLTEDELCYVTDTLREILSL